MRNDHAVTARCDKRIVDRVHAIRMLDFLNVPIAVVVEIVDVHGAAIRPAPRRICAMIHEIPMSEILENRLMVRLGIFHFVVDNAFLCPRSVQARRHGIIRRRGIPRRIAEVVISAEIMHPWRFEKIFNLDVFGRTRQFNHIFFEFHTAASIPRAPIHPNIVAIVKNRRVNVEFHVVRSVVGDKRLPNRILPRSRWMVCHGNANRKAFAPIFLDSPMMHRHVPVKFAISVFTMPRKSTRICPFERFHAQNRTVIVVMFHVIGHEHMPVVHDESLVVIALRPLFVVTCKNEKRIVMHERSRIGRIKISRKRVCRKGRRTHGKKAQN